jgi:hypothetical protein
MKAIPYKSRIRSWLAEGMKSDYLSFAAQPATGFIDSTPQMHGTFQARPA